MIGYGVNYRTGIPIHAGVEREGMEQPKTFWKPSIGASGLMIYDGDAFPEWRGDIFAGGLADIVRMEPADRAGNLAAVRGYGVEVPRRLPAANTDAQRASTYSQSMPARSSGRSR